MDYSKYGIDGEKPLLGYSNSDLKKLRSKFERYKDYEESCRKLPGTVGGALTGEGRSAARYLKSALELLNQSGAWSGPDGDSCRRVIETLYSDTASHYAKLEQAAGAMERKARDEANEITDVITTEVLPNMSFTGSLGASWDYFTKGN